MKNTIDPACELTVSREYRAPRRLVLKMLSDPEMLNRWWGPFGFSTTTHEMSFQPGGLWLHTMHGPDGIDYPNYIRYVQTSDDEIIYEHSSDSGQTFDFRTVITLEALEENRTKMEFRMQFESESECLRKGDSGARTGLQQIVVRLDTLLGEEQSVSDPFRMHLCLPSDTEIKVSRSFKTSKEQLFEYWVNANLIRQWQGPGALECKECSFDAQMGGLWSLEHFDPASGFSYKFFGKVLELDRPNRLVSTFEFDGVPGSVLINTAEFVEKGGVTTVTTTTRCGSQEERDGMVGSGMERGMTEGYDRLEKLLD